MPSYKNNAILLPEKNNWKTMPPQPLFRPVYRFIHYAEPAENNAVASRLNRHPVYHPLLRWRHYIGHWPHQICTNYVIGIKSATIHYPPRRQASPLCLHSSVQLCWSCSIYCMCGVCPCMCVLQVSGVKFEPIVLDLHEKPQPQPQPQREVAAT